MTDRIKVIRDNENWFIIYDLEKKIPPIRVYGEWNIDRHIRLMKMAIETEANGNRFFNCKKQSYE